MRKKQVFDESSLPCLHPNQRATRDFNNPHFLSLRSSDNLADQSQWGHASLLLKIFVSKQPGAAICQAL
jgi:hypothetical protein